MMIGCLLSFLLGGFLGILGMAAMAYGSKVCLMREIRILRERLEAIEQETSEKRPIPIADPRVKVDSLIN